MPLTTLPMSSCCCDNHTNQDGQPRRPYDWLLLAGVSICLFAILLYLWHPGWLPRFPRLMEFSHSVTSLFGKMWWGMLAGMLAIGILSHVPREWIVAALGKGLFRAIGLGLLFDLCSHGILLVGAKLYERGATIGQTFAFLIASPWNSFSVSLVLIGLIGLPWTLLFILLSAVVAFGAGLIADWLVRSGRLPENANRHETAAEFSLRREFTDGMKAISWHPGLIPKVLGAGLRESTMLVRWLLLGVILASLLRVWVSDEAFSTWFGASWAGLGITLLATTVIEVCSEGSSPIAADILNRADAPGNAFVFLMGGVATDYTEMMVLRETTRSWKLALALPLLTVPQVVLLGWIINHFAVS